MPKRRVADGVSPAIRERMAGERGVEGKESAATPKLADRVAPAAHPPAASSGSNGKATRISLATLTNLRTLERSYDLTCPKCRQKFETEPMLRPAVDAIIVCPSTKEPRCEFFGTFDSFLNPGPEPEPTTIGDFIVCSALIDRAKDGQAPKLEVCGKRYQNRIAGTGPHKAQNGLPGQFVGCPKCGALDRTVPVGRDPVADQSRDFDASEINAAAAGRKR